MIKIFKETRNEFFDDILEPFKTYILNNISSGIEDEIRRKISSATNLNDIRDAWIKSGQPVGEYWALWGKFKGKPYNNNPYKEIPKKEKPKTDENIKD